MQDCSRSVMILQIHFSLIPDFCIHCSVHNNFYCHSRLHTSHRLGLDSRIITQQLSSTQGYLLATDNDEISSYFDKAVNCIWVLFCLLCCLLSCMHKFSCKMHFYALYLRQLLSHAENHAIMTSIPFPLYCCCYV